MQTLINFVTNTLPKPVLFALAYRLSVLHLASYILPTIGADSWELEYGDDESWSARPVGSEMSISFYSINHPHSTDNETCIHSSHV